MTKRTLLLLFIGLIVALSVAPSARADHNDDFSQALPLAIGDDNTETTLGFSTQPNEWMTDKTIGYCVGQSSAVDAASTAWHEVVGNGRRLTVSGHSPEHGVILTVYRTTELSALSTSLVECNYDQTFQRQTVSVTWDSQPGVRYRVQVGRCRELTTDGQSARTPNRCGTGPGTLHVWLRANAAANDAAGAPLPLAAGGEEYDNVGATTATGESPACGAQPYGRTVWFTWQAPAKGDVTFHAATRTAGRGAMVMSVYSGGAKLACGEGSAGAIPVQAGGIYHVEIGGRGTGNAAEESRFALQPVFAQDYDVDDDKVAGVPVGSDCDDNNPLIHPGARDKPENGVDENCKGGDARFPSLRVSPRLEAAPAAGGYVIRRLLLRAVPRRAHITLRCRRGPGCAPGKRTIARRTRKKQRVMRVRTRGFGILRAGSTVELNVTKRGAVGRRFRWTGRESGGPRFVEFCLHPKRKRPDRC